MLGNSIVGKLAHQEGLSQLSPQARVIYDTLTSNRGYTPKQALQYTQELYGFDWGEPATQTDFPNSINPMTEADFDFEFDAGSRSHLIGAGAWLNINVRPAVVTADVVALDAGQSSTTVLSEYIRRAMEVSPEAYRLTYQGPKW